MLGRIYGFAPVEDENARVLIVGSMPSVASLEVSFYYGHPRNAFWPMIAEALGAPVPERVPDKKRLLIDNRIALWDVYASCVREGSLDSAIRAGETNDFASFFNAHRHIRCVLCNGGAAYDAFTKCFCAPVPVLRLPSTSPAYTKKFDLKLSAWKQALTEFLQGG